MGSFRMLGMSTRERDQSMCTKQPKILVIDDDPNLLRTIQLILERRMENIDVRIMKQTFTGAGYVTPAGTAVVGNNLNRVSGNAAQATAKADETGNVFAAANVVTTVRNSELATAEEGQWIDYDGALVLGHHDSVAVDIIGESATFECTIIGYFHG